MAAARNIPQSSVLLDGHNHAAYGFSLRRPRTTTPLLAACAAPSCGSPGRRSSPSNPERAGPARADGSAAIKKRTRIASPEMLPWPRALPHLKCSPRDCFEEQWNEEDEHDGARRDRWRSGTKVCGRQPRREDADSRRILGHFRLPSEVRDARVGRGHDPCAHGGRKSPPAHLRRRRPRGAGGALGDIRPHLRQTPEGVDADAGGGDGAARPSQARAGDPRRAASHERCDRRQVAGQGAGTSMRRTAAADGGAVVRAPEHPCTHVLGLGRPAAGIRRGRSGRAQRPRDKGELRSRRWSSPT